MGKKGGGKGGRKGSRMPPSNASSSSANKAEERRTKQQMRKQRGRKFGDAEERAYEEQINRIGGRIHHMSSDGNCLFRSIADQCDGRPQKHGEYRQKIVDFLEAHPDDFAPFMEDDEKFDDYISRMRNEREWGGQHELIAASRLFKVNVVIHQLNAPRLEIHYQEGPAKRTVHLSYHGESHYNSVRAIDDPCRDGEPAKPWAGVASVPSSPAPPPKASNGGIGGKKNKANRGGKEREIQREDGGGEDEEEAEEGAGNGEEGEGNGGPKEGKDEQQPAAADAAGTDGIHEEEEEEANKEGDDGKPKKVGGQCPCGSGKKWRKCCRKAEQQRDRLKEAAQRKQRPPSPPPASSSSAPSVAGGVDELAEGVKAISL